MSPRKATKAGSKTAGSSKNPYGYPFWEWVAREDPEYVRARQPLSELSGRARSCRSSTARW